MNDESYYKQLLINADDLQHYEFIPGTDWNVLYNQVEKFVDRLKQKMDIYLFETGAAIQHATFHSIIWLRLFSDHTGITIRFSNFGNFVYIGNYRRLSKNEIELILNLFREFNYIYIPEDIVMTSYDGKNEALLGGNNYTWSDRFFDYV